MKHFYLVLVSMILLFNFGTAQETTRFDVNGDIIPPEAVMAESMRPQAEFAIDGQEQTRGEWMSKGPWGGNLRGFATDIDDDMNVVIACGHSTGGNGGMWYSNDGGQNWNASSIYDKIMYGVCAHPTIGGKFYAGGKYGLYESTDVGATWELLAFPSTTIIGVGLQLANTDLMVAGISSNQGLKYSNDGGANWLVTNLTQGFMKGFANSPNNPELMFVAVSGSNGSGLYSSTDGDTWTSINPAESGQCYGIYVDPTDADMLLLGAENGIFKSIDGGANWTLTQSTSNFSRGVVKYNDVYYSAVYGGSIYESVDAGDTWTVANEDIGERTWQAMGVSGAGALFGNWGSIALCDGQDYVLSVQGLKNAYVHCTVYYADRNELWAGTEGSGIWCSTDMGETWENKSNGLQGWWAYSFAPTNSEDWAVNRRMVATNNGIYYSDDFGENWLVLNQETTYYTGAMIHWTDPDIMWIGGSTGPIKYTTDGGATWIDPVGLPFAFYPRFSLCANTAGEPRVLLIYEQLGTNSYYSDDLGANFSACTGLTGVSYFTDLSIRMSDNKLDQKVYMSTDKGIYQSADGEEYTICPNLTGLTWCVLGTEGTDVYAGANSGVYHSTDEGQTWEAFNQGIDYMAVWDLCYGNTTASIYAGTRGYSVIEYSVLEGKIQGFVRNAVTNQAIDEAEITAISMSNGTPTYTTPFGAHYSMILPAGVYDFTCEAEGYETETVEGIEILGNANTGYTFLLEPTTNEPTTGMDDLGNNTYMVYPNPAKDQLTVCGNNITLCEIFNQSGQVVLTVEDVMNKSAINISQLSAGVYFIRISAEQGLSMQKLIIE